MTPERPTRLDAKPEYAPYRRNRDPKEIFVQTTQGVRRLSGVSRPERRLVSRHSNAVKYALDVSRQLSVGAETLHTFQHSTVTGFEPGASEPRTFHLETGVEHVARNHWAGDLDYESLYANAAT